MMEERKAVKRSSKRILERLLERPSVLSAAAIVVFVTTYMLILPAITMTTSTSCGMEEHTHSSECYTQTKTLTCTAEETESHVHSEECYEDVPVLTCTQTEQEAHTHDDECYEYRNELICPQEECEGHTHGEECFDEDGELICTQEEREGHVHSDDCYQTQSILICTIEESEGHVHYESCYSMEHRLICEQEEGEGHTHSDSCYSVSKELTCAKQEHVHSEECYADRTADEESADVWDRMFDNTELSGVWADDLLTIAESQVGYSESTANYIVDENGNKKGYTRYGHWYGNRYGEWCAMFVSFCIDYAGIDTDLFPLECNCQNWINTLSRDPYNLYHDSDEVREREYALKLGDLIFFDWNTDGTADHIGIVYEIEYDAEKEDTIIRTIEGNCSDAVRKQYYGLSETCVKGFGEVPENPELEKELIYNGTDYTVAVRYDRTAELPEDTALSVEELTGEECDARVAEAEELTGLSAVRYARFFRISLLEDEEEVEPEGNVQVEIRYAQSAEMREDEIAVMVHYAEDTEMEEVTPESGEEPVFRMESNHLSDYGTLIASLNTEEINTLAAASQAPAIGSAITAINVNQPEIGKWYIIYGVSPADLEDDGYAVIADMCTYQTKLDLYSTDYGTVKYTGRNDVAWEYTANGFRNRNGQYLVLKYNSSTGKSDMSFQSTTYSGGVHYDRDHRTVYETEQVSENSRYVTRYNEVYMHTWTTDDELRNSGESYDSLAYIAQSLENKRDVFIAEIQTEEQETDQNWRHPKGSETGSIGDLALVLYNVDGSSGEIHTLPGVQYTIYDQAGNVVQSITTTDSYIVKLKSMPDGTYTVKQTAVPEGYSIHPQETDFTVENGVAYIGIFYDYKDESHTAVNGKTGEVVDYQNRTYRINMGAQSIDYTYTIEKINYEIIVDQSNSMLFPSELTEVKSAGETVTVNLKRTTQTGENGAALDRLVAEGKIDINKVYYVIADETQTSTVYAIWHDGTGWCYQDAAYYAKAQMHEYGITHNAAEDPYVYVSYAKANGAYSVNFTDSEGNQTGAKGGGGLDFYGTADDGQTYYSVGSTLGAELKEGKDMILYEGSPYNRLHDLQQAVMVFGSQVGSLNENSTLDLITFDKEVESCITIGKLDSDGLAELYEAVDRITTMGGTQQNKALDHVRGAYAGNATANHNYNHLEAGEENIVILITDGAPVNGPTIATVETAGVNLKYESDLTALVSVGLSMKNVTGGSAMLQYIASPDPNDTSRKMCFESEEAGELSEIMLEEILLKYGQRQVNGGTADIKDVISDSFYPIDPATNLPLISGTRLNLDGTVNADGPGVVLYDEENKEWYVIWENQDLIVTKTEGSQGTEQVPIYTDHLYYRYNNSRTEVTQGRTYVIDENGNLLSSGGSLLNAVPTSRVTNTIGLVTYSNGKWNSRNYTWNTSKEGYRYNNTNTDITSRFVTETETTYQTIHTSTPDTYTAEQWTGMVYLKAKEDFIGGNTIDTNKKATVTTYAHNGDLTGISTLSVPTVNVRILPIEGFESEETVFLGDEIADIRGKLKKLMEMTVIHKINPYYGMGEVLNYKEGATNQNGCYEDHFTIPYAIRELTEDEWNTLLSGGTVQIDYTYDDSSSHGAVGYFSFSLTEEGTGADTADHAAEETGEDVEKYILNVTYTAYGIGETDQSGVTRKEDVHNGPNGPGTEVGKGSAIPTGAGSVTADEIHHVYVIDGEILLTKIIDQTLISDTDQDYTFCLYRKGSDEILDEVTVTVKAGETTGTIRIDHLKRNRYLVKEKDSDLYVVEKVDVVNDDTNCEYDEDMPMLEFDIGTNVSSQAADHNVIIFNEELPTYEESLWVEDERYVYSKPFTKVNTSEQAGRSTGTHIEYRTETVYAWESGTLITADTGGSTYVRAQNSREALDASHTDYGILTQDSEDHWSIEWHIWTSREETIVTPGISGYAAETIGYAQNNTNPPDLSRYANGDYYYYDGTNYQKITAIRSDGYNIIISTAAVSNKYVQVTATWLNNSNYITYDVYKLNSSGGTETTTTIWSENTHTETAVNNRIPTKEIQVEVEVPDPPDESEDILSSSISVGHGEIRNTEAVYTADIPVMKIWDDGGEHSSDTVYVVLYDRDGNAVTDNDGVAKMLKLDAAGSWEGTFTISAPVKNYDPLQEGYYVREVKRMERSEFHNSQRAGIVNSAGDIGIYYITAAEENGLVNISGADYNVHYASDGTKLYVTNNKAYSLPESGGTGTRMYTSSGGLLLISAVVIYLIGQWRRRERRSC